MILVSLADHDKTYMIVKFRHINTTIERVEKKYPDMMVVEADQYPGDLMSKKTLKFTRPEKNVLPDDMALLRDLQESDSKMARLVEDLYTLMEQNGVDMESLPNESRELISRRRELRKQLRESRDA